MPTPPLFELQDLWLSRSGPGSQPQRVLCGITAAIPGEGITCLVGASGSGKSTLLRLLNRLEDPDRGAVLFRGQPLRDLNPLEHRRRVGLVLQTPVMLPGTVRQNLEAGPKLCGRTLQDPALLLVRVGLPAGMLEKTASDLSGGEKQRVALARTLAVQPEVLLLDEVTASLDPDSAAAVERLVTDLGLPAVWVSHDPAQVARVANRVLRLEAGRTLEEVGMP